MSTRSGAIACGAAALTVFALFTWEPARAGVMAVISHLQTYNGAYSLFGTMILAGLTLRYVVLTSHLLNESRLMRQTAAEPVVVAAVSSRDGMMILQLANVGSGPAYKLRLRCDPELAFFNLLSDLTEDPGRRGSKISDLLGFKHPIPCLPVRGFKEIPLAYQCIGWTQHKTDFTITASFVDGIGRPQNTSYILNFDRTQGIRPEDHDSLEQIAAEIRGLKQEMGMRG
jgi:hypothetical protein